MAGRFFTTEEAAEYIGMRPQTLRLSRTPTGRKRFKWTPPPHYQRTDTGRVFYLLEDLDTWLEAQRRTPPLGNGRPRSGRKSGAEA